MKHLLIDTSLFSSDAKHWKETIVAACQKEGLPIVFKHVRSRGNVHDGDLSSLVGLGISTAALVIALLQLWRTPKETWTRKKLVDEIDSFLKLKGIENYRFTIEVGFENLLEDNGRPCILAVELEDRATRLYLGITRESIQISAVEYDYRELP